MNKQQLAAKIWESANQMRSKIEANEYKDYILGFIFYKFLSEQELRLCKKDGFSEEDIRSLSEDDASTAEYIKKKLGYFIAYENLFSTWINSGNDFGIDNVRDALSAFERNINKAHVKVFENIFETLQTGLSKLGESAQAQTKAARDLIHLINDIPMDGRQDYDVLGFIYEYLISNFAANAGKKAGEFYTPHEVSLLMSEIIAHHLREKPEIKIYDPTSGSGSLLINIGKAVARRNNSEDGIKYYAQELKQNTYNLTRMNLVMRGILADNIVTRNGDTLEQDWPYFDESDPVGTYDPLYVHAVVSNPPYSQKWDPTDKDGDPRFDYGLAPKSKADYAFLLHDLNHLRPEGIMTIVLPHGVLFRGGDEAAIRKNLIENRHISAIIGLPPNIFFGTGIPTIVMVLRKKREESDVLIVDASKGFEKEGKNNKLRACDIKKITDTVISRENVDKFSRVVSIDEIRENDYNLNIPRYVDSSEEEETWDIYASMFGGIPVDEINALEKYWQAWPSLRGELFKENSTPFAELATPDVKAQLKNNSDIQAFKESFKRAFVGFDAYLNDKLISNFEELNIAEAEPQIAHDLFTRLEGLPLVDKYEAYQILDDAWQQTEIDLEILQSEGLEAAKVVDPNMVIKKKNGKDQEVQDGWVGHVLPFDLVQKAYLNNQVEELENKEEKLAIISSRYEEILESLSEEDKGSDAINEAGDAFVAAEVKKLVKEIKKAGIPEEGSFEEVLLDVASLSEKEKALKKEIKQQKEALHLATKDKIEILSDTEVRELLHQKWVAPIIDGIFDVPVRVSNEAASKINTLAQKYEVTLGEVAQEIAETESELTGMINQLVGSEYDMLGLQEFKVLLGGE